MNSGRTFYNKIKNNKHITHLNWISSTKTYDLKILQCPKNILKKLIVSNV